MPKKVEFIESYIKVDGSDYQYCDNHGVLTRCRDCAYWQYDRIFKQGWCAGRERNADDYCSRAERKEADG